MEDFELDVVFISYHIMNALNFVHCIRNGKKEEGKEPHKHNFSQRNQAPKERISSCKQQSTKR